MSRSSLRERAERLRRKLSEALGRDVTSPAILGPCAEIIAIVEGAPVFIYVHEGRYSEEGLVVKLLPTKSDCQESLMRPEGLLAVDTNVERLAEKVARKALIVRKLASIK